MKTPCRRLILLVSAPLVIILTLTCSLSAKAQNQSTKIKRSFKSLTWLEGKWQQTNTTRPNRTGYEIWRKVNNLEYNGIGYTMQSNDTLFIEKLSIIIAGNEIHYVADVSENPQPVHFVFTSQKKNAFVCENQTHDYPKKISYELKDDTLHAITSGNGKEQKFLFIRSR